jgi:GNAT superfamily N-acetyltransferase
MEINYTVRSTADDPALAGRMQDLIEAVWPRYITQGSSPPGHPFHIDWFGIHKRWPHYQIALFDSADGELVACANGLTLAWDGDEQNLPDEGWDWAMHQGELDYKAGLPPKTACALSVTIRSDVRGQNLSRTLLELLRQQAHADGLARLIVPVRPNLKARYPITPIEEYLTWTNEEGLPFDPWLRVHVRMKARVVKACPRAVSIGGTVAEWEGWTGMKFPGSGAYIVPEMLAPLQIDRAADQGLYVEPNVWVVHDAGGK